LKIYSKDLEKLISNELSLNASSNSFLTDSESYNKNDLEGNFLIKENKNKRVTFPSDSQIVQHSSSYQNINSTDKSTQELDRSYDSVTTTTSSIVDNKIIKRKVVR
jgi:hypothetical protein